MAEHKDSYCYRVRGLFVPYLTPATIDGDINKYIDKIDRLTEDLENSFNSGAAPEFERVLEKILGLLQPVYAKQCESHAVALLYAVKNRGLTYCGKLLQQAIADFLLLSIEMQKAQKLATPHAAKYAKAEVNEEAARSLSAVARLIGAGDYDKARSMASELKDRDNTFARLSEMLAAHEYGRAEELANVMEQEHIGLIRRTGAKTSKLVLAVDDMPEILASVGAALRGHYRVLGAPGAEVALDILSQQKIDLIFMDIEMPGTDGFELTGRIRADARYRETPILFLTANSSRANIERAISLGSNDFIVKPAYDVTLLAKARKYLG